MPWYYAVVERYHELQNPTSPEKIRLLGERLGLGPESHVLDVASGRGGPALVLAGEFGCRITCVERAAEFAEVARQRTYDAGLDSLIDIVHADASAFPLEPGYDAAICLGARASSGTAWPERSRRSCSPFVRADTSPSASRNGEPGRCPQPTIPPRTRST